MGWRIGAYVRWLGVVLVPLSLSGCGRSNRGHHGSSEGGEPSALGGAGAGGAETAGGGEGGTASCTEGPALAKARIWRLTDAQYVNAVRQVFGVSVGPVITDSDPLATEYVNLSELSVVNAKNALQYQTAARDVAAQAVASHYADFMPCGSSAACVDPFIRNRIARAFGRRLDDVEVARYASLFQKGATRSPQEGVRLMIEATLQSPAFLYRTELGPPAQGGPQGQVALTSTEIATLLALSFTDALPDEPLWQKADTGALVDPAVLEQEVERLLDLPETQAHLANLMSYWLGAQGVRGAAAGAKLAQFPELTPALKADLGKSAQYFVRDLLLNGQVRDLVTSKQSFLNEALAGLYGVSGVKGEQLRPVAVDAAERGYGILSQPGVLAGQLSAVERGWFVFNALACGDQVLAPPANHADAAPAPGNATERELAGQRAADAQCAPCHAGFDPLGLLSARYDALGRYTASNAVDETAVLSSLGPDLDGPTQGLGELAAKLSRGRRLSDCAAQNLAGYALGRPDVGRDGSCALVAIKDKLAETGKLRDFYKALATSPAFVERDAD